MGRRPRQHYPGAFYHFIARGNNRRPIFLSAHDRRAFEHFLSEGVERFDTRCHAFCWMTNHVHMAIEVADVPLSHVAHNLLFRYARWFNRKYDRSGHLFERRYRAFLVETDDAFLSLIRYIHLNPVRAQIVTDPRVFRWSSYSAYLDPGRRPPSCLVSSFALSLLAEDASEARSKLRAFTEMEIEESTDRVERPAALEGRPPGRQRVNSATTKQGTRSPVPVRSGVSVDQILAAVSSACGLDPSELRADVQKRSIVAARSLASFLVQQSPHLTLEELSTATGRDASTLSRGATNTAERLARDPEIGALLKQVQGRLSRN